MNNPRQNYNHIRHYHKPKHPEDLEFLEFEDNYVFKTHPSFHFSEQTSKHLPKSEHYFNTKIDSREDGLRKHNKTKRNPIKHHNQEEPMSLSKQELQKNEKQVILKQKIAKLIKSNQSFQEENIQLRNYVQFLQDYNLKLKKQLMRVLRRRNLDSSLSSMYDQQIRKNSDFDQKQEKIQPNLHKQNLENQYFSTIQPLQKLISKPIFTNHRLANQGPYRNISFGQTQQQQTRPVKYVAPFYETTQKPLYHNFYKQKDQYHYEKLKKIEPTSFKTSFLNISDDLNPQIYSNQKEKQINKICNCLNQSLPVIQNVATPVSHNQNYYRSLDHSSDKILEKPKKNDYVCIECLKSAKQTNINTKQTKNKKKSTKHKQKNLQNVEKSNKSTSQRCASCNDIKSSKRSNASKSTIPTRQKQASNIFHFNQLSKKLNSSQDKRAKPQRIQEKIEITEFRP